MQSRSDGAKVVPLDIVGSSTYGRDPKIMASRTYNMIIADDWLIDYAGYKKVLNISPNGKGRGIFTSVRANKLITVIDNKAYAISIYPTSNPAVKTYLVNFIGDIQSLDGDVFIDENITNQIAICDQSKIYIYNYVTGDFQIATLPEGFIPGYVTYQDGRFIATDVNSSSWALSQVGDGLNWFWGASGEPVLGSIQTKANLSKAALRFPGRGNLLLVMGNNVTELWTDVGGAVFPYQKSSSVNVDYGCVNSATLAASEHIVAWLGSNEKSGPVIMYSTGSEVEQISTDGINDRFSQLNHPEKSVAFFVKLSGHLIYHLTFYDPSDNYSLIYDFTTKKFFDVTNEKMNYHIARRVAFIDNDYYFVSLNDGNIYQMSASLTTFDYGEYSDRTEKIYEIPRIRTCSNLRLPNSQRFVVNNLSFTLEQGNDTDNTGNDPNYVPRIGLCMSKNGGVSFGSYSTRPIYRVGKRANVLNWWGLGCANDVVYQFRFWGKGPWKSTNGVAEIYK